MDLWVLDANGNAIPRDAPDPRNWNRRRAAVTFVFLFFICICFFLALFFPAISYERKHWDTSLWVCEFHFYLPGKWDTFSASVPSDESLMVTSRCSERLTDWLTDWLIRVIWPTTDYKLSFSAQGSTSSEFRNKIFGNWRFSLKTPKLLRNFIFIFDIFKGFFSLRYQSPVSRMRQILPLKKKKQFKFQPHDLWSVCYQNLTLSNLISYS